MSSLYKQCEEIYEQGGQYAVFDFIEKEHPEIKWVYCEPCECICPMDPLEPACLVCGSVFTEENIAKGDTESGRNG